MCVVKCHFGSLMTTIIGWFAFYASFATLLLSIINLHVFSHIFQFNNLSVLLSLIPCCAIPPASDYRSSIFLFHFNFYPSFCIPLCRFNGPLSAAAIADRCPPPLLLTADVSRTAVCLHCPRPPTSLNSWKIPDLYVANRTTLWIKILPDVSFCF